MANIIVGTLLKSTKGEVAKVIEVNEKSKQAIVEFEDGSNKAYSFPTLKDKRRFTILEEELSNEDYEAAVRLEVSDMEKELTDEEYAEIGKEIADQAKAKAKGVSGSKGRISITYRGQTKTPFEWGRLLGLDPKYIRAQLRKGKKPEEIFKEKK